MPVDTSFHPISLKGPAERSGFTRQGLAQADGGSGRSLNALQNQILQNLARAIPGESLGSLKRLDASDFTPEKVADRIATFVEMGLANARARGASGAELEALREQATQGVEQGFREAREILSGLNLLEGRIAEDVDETERLTFAALEDLRLPPAERSLAGTTALSMSERFSRAESLELNITTQSGAEVQIRFQSVQDARLQTQVQVQDGAADSWLDVSRYAASGYQFSVQGDLDPDELRAVEELVRDIGSLADEFFHGDVQRAFEMLPDLRFDTDRLQSMELNMTRTETYRMTQAYEQTQQLDAPEHSRAAQRLEQLVEALQERFSQPALQFLDNPVDTGGQILNTLVEQDARFREAEAERQQQFRDNLTRLLDALG
ncbi:DUF5610 domain-containing protein [Thioalkalivibrio sp. ALE17]|uniref:DUF5610 domain-containing protein n=1 Tax=Thioalkalivibrio sp. ALE17 TaxID=1158173 RepID=UPI0003FC481B|nr:DUF5610 domain-containing protein [Thioalkalivibrio sp. ALE17]